MQTFLTRLFAPVRSRQSFRSKGSHRGEMSSRKVLVLSQHAGKVLLNRATITSITSMALFCDALDAYPYALELGPLLRDGSIGCHSALDGRDCAEIGSASSKFVIG